MGRPSKLSQTEVLERATELFWVRGYDDVTTRDLEEAVGIRAPAIYRRFPSKDELFAACIEHYIDTVLAGRIEGAFDDGEDPLDGLHRYFLATLHRYGDEKRLRGCLLTNTATAAVATHPGVRAAVERGWRLLDEAFQKQIERAQGLGQLDPNADKRAMSQALIMSLLGVWTMIRAGVTELRPGIDAAFAMLGAEPRRDKSGP